VQDKLRVYKRSGVREYIVWQTEEKSIAWFDLADGEYRPLPCDERGFVESRVFPGLLLATHALIAGNLTATLAEVDKGNESPRDRQSVARLAANTWLLGRRLYPSLRALRILHTTSKIG